VKHGLELPLDKLKIDASFVQSMVDRRESRKIVASVIGLGRSLGLTTVAEILPNRSPEADECLTRALAGEDGVEFEATQSGKPDDMAVFHVSLAPVRDEAGEVVSVSGAVVDISERARVRREARDSEDHFRYLVELGPYMPWTADPVGQLVDFSTRREALTGTSRGATLGTGWIDAVHPEDRGTVRMEWMRALRTRKPMDVAARVRLTDGHYRWMRSRRRPSLCCLQREMAGCCPPILQRT
jgi:PAS domain S-box-containing protein